MSEANVVFTLDGENLIVQCSKEDKLRGICQTYSTKIKEKMNTLFFLYRGNQVNFELSFKDHVNPIDRNNNEMKILVYKFVCPECNEKINLNKEKLEKIILCNEEIEDSIKNIKLKIDNIIKISSKNSLNIQLQNINNMLINVVENIKKNKNEIKNLLGDYINTENNNNFISHPISTNSKCEINKKLIENIKSKYISKIVFSYLNEKIKLKAIKYNKKLKNKIDIKLINYKFYTEKYIIYETNIKGKEYQSYNDKLIFEGEYLNGKRNGKGKEYNEYGELIFEGEYLNGKKNGKGKEYDKKLKLEYEGEYLNGERNGKGKEYYCNGILKFEGEYLNGEKVAGNLLIKMANYIVI